jgi:hypothetical protein
MKVNSSPDISFEEDVHYYIYRMRIPDDEQLKKHIFEVEHNSNVDGYVGHDKTIELVRQNIFWPPME